MVANISSLSVFWQNAVSDEAEVTSWRLFHTLGPAVTNNRLPTETILWRARWTR